MEQRPTRMTIYLFKISVHRTILAIIKQKTQTRTKVKHQGQTALIGVDVQNF